jgi:hypothetical protein
MIKKAALFLILSVYTVHILAMAFDYKLSPAMEAAQLSKLNSFIKTTGFTGKYYLSNDKRVFQRLEGTFNLPEVTDTMIFSSNCNRILKSVLKLYNPGGEMFTLKLSGYVNDKTPDKYLALYNQFNHKLRMNVLSNYAAYHKFKYKRHLGADSLKKPRDLNIRTYFNPDSLMQYVSYKEGFADYNSSIEIKYDGATRKYCITNYLFSEPVVIPALKIEAEEAKKIPSLGSKVRIVSACLEFYAFPLNHNRSVFEYKLLWHIETSDTHGGWYYYIDATTGNIFHSGCSWMD